MREYLGTKECSSSETFSLDGVRKNHVMTAATELRQALAAFTEQGNIAFVPFYQGLLAKIEAQGDAEGALVQTER